MREGSVALVVITTRRITSVFKEIGTYAVDMWFSPSSDLYVRPPKGDGEHYYRIFAYSNWVTVLEAAAAACRGNQNNEGDTD